MEALGYLLTSIEQEPFVEKRSLVQHVTPLVMIHDLALEFDNPSSECNTVYCNLQLLR